MIEVFTDGATSKNGSVDAFGGAAWVVLQEDKILEEGSIHVPNATSNICELLAAINGCSLAQELSILDQDGEFEFRESIIIYTDSAYIHNCFTQKWYENWQRNGWVNSKKQPVANKELWMKLIPFFEAPNFTFKKVPGHAGNKWNDYVDKLAVQAKFDSK